MVGAGLTSALESLRAERARLENAIVTLEALLGGSGAAPAAAARKRPGRPRKAARAPAVKKPAKAKRGRKNAPKGMLKAKIHQVLAAAKQPLKPVELKRALLKAGFPAKNEQTLYTQIFASTKKDPAVKKTEEGYVLKAGAKAAAPAVAKVTTAAK